MGVVCYRVHHTEMVAIELLCTHESLTKTTKIMWHIISFILAMIGALVALSGEPVGALGFAPMIIGQIWCDIKPSKKQ